MLFSVSIARVKDADSEKGLVWLDPVKFNNTYTLMMNKAEAEKLGIKSISDLGVYVTKNPDELIFALDSEFWERPDGFKGIMKTYNFKLPPKQVKKMSVGLTYQALKEEHWSILRWGLPPMAESRPSAL